MATAWIFLATTLVVLPTTPARADVVLLSPGANIQEAVEANAVGTIFNLAAGMYPNQQVTPKDGQQFIGSGADTILSGAVTLTGWKQRRNTWYVTGQIQQGQVHGQCEGGWSRCNRPEDLFVDGETYRHVSSRGQLGPGRWYFDYKADRIYLGEDPTGKLVETSVTRHAFLGDADGVVIKDMVIEKYAVPAQHGAIDSRTSNIGSHGSDWTVDGVEGRLNHGGAVYLTNGGSLLNSNLHHNGQQAISATGTGLLIEGNEFSFNNTAHFDLDWEGGASKFWSTIDLVFRNNHSHHNYGTGVWADYENLDSLIEDNTVSWNYREGIYVEISLSAIVRNNHVEGNGLDDPRGDSWLWSGGITVAASSNVEVYGNTVTNNGNGITATQQSRGSGSNGPWLVENLHVHHNDVTMFEGQTGIVQDVGDREVFLNRNNRFEENTYRGDGQALLFAWDDSSHTFPEWRSLFDHDWSGRFDSTTGDNEAPVLTLLGDNPMAVALNGGFTDPGATATDNFDPRMVVNGSGSVDTTLAGSYELTYVATDSADNEASSVTRTVIVGDPAVLPEITVTSGADASEPGTPGHFTISRTGDLGSALQVQFTLSGTAGAGADYADPGSVVDILADEASVQVPITPVDDLESEGSESVTLTVDAGPGYTIGDPGAATLAIIDDDPLPPTVTVAAGADASEAGSAAGWFTITRSGPTDQSLEVSLDVSGTADSPADFAAIAPALEIPTGASSVQIDVLPADDELEEGPETVVITLLSGPGYIVGTPDTAEVFIIDDDQPTTFAAISEVTVKGAVTGGTYLSTHGPDDAHERLTEEIYGGGKRSRMEHRWTFDIGTGSAFTFTVEAHRSTGVDEFVFEFSPDGASWTPLVTITATGNDEGFSHPLPAGASGIVQVRAIDTDRSRNEGTASELFVDWMAITAG
ncbi:MAG: DUF5011 domain-containing protein [Acidimicrobiia bacterium]|nr:DUF5011 domain-containing protein [Acidimicrobiia bacterium]